MSAVPHDDSNASDPVDLVRVIDEGPITPLQVRVIALCSLATFLDGYDVQALGLAVPHLADHFDVAPTAFAPALSGSLIGMALGAVALSPLADRFGRRAVLVAMMLLIGLSTVGVILSRGPYDLAAWRVLTGLGLGATLPIAIAMTAEYSPARRRAALVTMMVACAGLGSFAAGIVAPIFEAQWGWRGIFGVGAVLPLFTAGLLWLALPESLRFLILRNPADPRIAAQAEQLAPGRQVTFVPATASGDKTVRGARSLFTSRLRARTMLLWAIFWLNLFANYSLISWLPTLLTGAGLTRETAQRATGLLALGGIGGGLLLAYFVDRGRMVPAIAAAYVITAIALSMFVLAPGAGAYWAPLLAVIGAGAIGSQMALGSVSAAFYPPEVRTTGLGWSAGFGRTGAIVGPLALAALMSGGVSPNAIIALLMVPMLICSLLVTRLPSALRD